MGIIPSKKALAENDAARAENLSHHVGVLEAELDTLYAILRAVVDGVEKQTGVASELDPTDDLVRAMRDARSWLGEKQSTT